MSDETREILVPHEPTRGALKAVRRVLVQSSLAKLRELGFYEPYRALVDPETLETITTQIGPGWLLLELAMAHYRACDALRLSDAQIDELGGLSGDKLAHTLLVARGNKTTDVEVSPWLAVGAFSRMGRRIHDGGSTQYVRLGPKQLLIESVGNPLFAIDYYRAAHLAFLRRAFGSLGVNVTESKLTAFRPQGAIVEVRLTWA